HPSMLSYCVVELHLSDDAAYKRIRAARAGLDHPALLIALADGRLHLTAVGLLKGWLTSENVQSLIDAATHKTKAEIEQLIADRFPRSETLALVESLPAGPGAELVPEPVASRGQLVPEPVRRAPSKSSPIAPDRFLWQFTVGKDTNDLLRRAQ